MTTGTYGTSAFSIVPGTVGQWAYRDWTGGNGKYSSPGRAKWNNYQCEQAYMSISKSYVQFACSRPGGGTDSTFPISNSIYRYYETLAISSNEVNRVLSRILDAAKDHSFNLAVNTSQLKETSNMVVSNLGKLGRAMQALRHGNFSMAAHQLSAEPRVSQAKPSDIAGRWLELQYGWLPLLSDVHDAATAYHAITEGPRFRIFSATANNKGSFTYPSPWSPNVSMSQKAKRSRRYVFEQDEVLSTPRSLGLTDPASVLWENIPYSFVVDWFVPIGTYLSNLNQIPYLSGSWHTSEVIMADGQVNIARIGDASTYPFCGYHGLSHRYDRLNFLPAFSCRRGYYQRGSYGSPPPVPLPSFDDGGLTNHSRRVWNAIALAYQRFLK
jgi:hypothetical protein